MLPPLETFTGNERFVVERRVGQGGFGVVYQVFDRHQQARLALKVLRQPDALHRLKREFRALADLAHPNLVQLYELLSDGMHSFITMELLDGQNFLDFVREGWSMEDGDVARPPNSSLPRFNLDRLQGALAQLAEGLCFLHAAGKLHRDIKPSNVLVTRQRRVVLLDFGLATEVSPDYVDSLENFGTPAYMAPEQGTGEAMTEAADWYSVGIVLFEALTGRRPFEGAPLDILAQKRQRDAPAAREQGDGIPEWLDEMCRQLLARNPADRATGRDVLRRMSHARDQFPLQVSAVQIPFTSPRDERLFVGRERHLEELTDAFHAATEGQTVTVYVHGSSGVGKTALIRRFLRELPQREPNVVVLAGRCYERESVPYKALDGVVDALSRYLETLPRSQAEALLPRDVRTLARLFPVFHRVEWIATVPHRMVEVPDAQELRRRAFAALRELLSRLGDRRSLVLSIDDLQWGDVDSAALLADLLRPPDTPALLLIASYRSEEASTSLPLRTLISQHPASSARGAVRELEVRALGNHEARTLVRELLSAEGPSADVHTDAIIREAGGSPFFIHELVRQSEGAGWHPLEGTLDDVILGRVARLPEGARRLLEILSVFGHPLERSVARRAAELESGELSALAVLRSASLTRVRTSEGLESIEPYHDRIRETVSRHLAPGVLRSHHHRLAIALETTGGVDPEVLAAHFEGAADFDRAASYAESAAARAVDTLAFDRAARLYRLALDLKPSDASGEQQLRVRLGDALANAGRGFDAAHSYLAAVEGAGRAEAIELQRRAALQLLISGQIAPGVAVLRTVLAELGMKMAETPRGALGSILVRRAYARLRGLRFRDRDESQVPAEQLIRVDTCWSAAVGLGLVDTIRGAEFQARHLLLALRTGEPYRIARAVALQASYTAAAGIKTRHHVDRLILTAQALAERVNRPQAFALVALVRGIAAFMVAEWKAASDLCRRAEQILRERCTGVAWELDTACLFRMRCLVYMGELTELSQQLPVLYQEARERGDLLLETYLGTNIAYLTHLAADDPALAYEGVQDAIEHWPHERFDQQHHWALHASVESRLYEGNGPGAWELVSEKWPALRRSLLMRAQLIRIRVRDFHARSALAAAFHHGTDTRRGAELVRTAERGARRIARERIPGAAAIGQMTMAGVSVARGRPHEACRLLLTAETTFATLDMQLHAAAARRRRGQLVGGDEGRGLVAEADAWMIGQAIRNPARMTGMFAPGAYDDQVRHRPTYQPVDTTSPQA
jgi:tRNA A-37 threonylcarbamoyl transferase component Bud32